LTKYGPSQVEKKLYAELVYMGLKPEPQYEISDMHVDFAFPEQKLVIEVNGLQHYTKEGKERDRKRYFVLKKEGWKVKSFHSDKVWKHTKFVAEKIKEELEKIDGTYQPKTTEEPISTRGGYTEREYRGGYNSKSEREEIERGLRKKKDLKKSKPKGKYRYGESVYGKSLAPVKIPDSKPIKRKYHYGKHDYRRHIEKDRKPFTLSQKQKKRIEKRKKEQQERIKKIKQDIKRDDDIFSEKQKKTIINKTRPKPTRLTNLQLKIVMSLVLGIIMFLYAFYVSANTNFAIIFGLMVGVVSFIALLIFRK